MSARVACVAALVLLAALLAVLAPNRASSGFARPAASASGWTIVKFPVPQPGCAGVGLTGSLYFDTLSCGFGTVAISDTPSTASVTFTLTGSDGSTIESQAGTWRDTDSTWEFEINPTSSWPAGKVTVTASTAGVDVGSSSFFVNQLGASATAASKPGGYSPGDAVPVTGSIFEQKSLATSTQHSGVPATFSLSVVRPDGVKGPYGPFTAASDGTFAATLPAGATAGVNPTGDTNWQSTLGLRVENASYSDLLSGTWKADDLDAGSVKVARPPAGLTLDNSFVSSVGWVKPGDTYPFTLTVRNYETTPKLGATLTLPAVDGMTFTKASASLGTAVVGTSGITWTLGTVPAGSGTAPTVVTLIGEAKAKTLTLDPKVVWKNLSSTGSLTWTGATAPVTAKSHGPKVIPVGAQYDTARYGDRPFPVIPVDYVDRGHENGHTGELISDIINSPDLTGSTFNLYQEISYGQLFPHADVPSAGVASAGWDAKFNGYRKDTGFQFTQLAPAGTCHGVTLAGQQGTQLLPSRIKDGWYQLPGTTDYYGDDKYGTALIGAVAGVGALQDIDSACGPTGKLVYDAAMAADPDIDYSDFDTDKDGIVDFFMVVFPGLGGNGDSQVNGLPSYDNVWPHSSNLESYFTDSGTGQRGYVTDDQDKDLEGRPLYYTDSTRATMTTTKTDFPVWVRVGPYNVNPESAVDKHSVISHEYGHSLGLPDFYSIGSRETYGSWMLMASDYSQNMDVFGKQELGWLVPRVLKPGTTTVTGWHDSKTNTHQIDWVQPNGTPYTLTGASVNNGQGYVAKLPGRQVIDPATVPSGSHVWWSQSGNDFGCSPSGGHNLDIPLPQLASVPAGTPVTVTFKSNWQMEWDFDYGFVMTTTNGKDYTSLPSQNGYTTDMTTNPNTNACQGQYGNGITGATGSYTAGTQTLDRVRGAYPAGGFVDDSYDLSSLAGQAGAVLRLSYSTDPGVAKQGWFIDDLKITAGSQTIYSSDFENGGDDPALYNGGCRDSLQTSAQCTHGWQYLSATDGSPADHAYYLEMRDRSGFDAKDGHGQSDRGDITFLPGLYLMYTDESHGYGNYGTDDPPAQSPLDASPEPGNNTPNLDDAAFNQGESFSDWGDGHVDNYKDPSSADGFWHFADNCLKFDVPTMSGDDVGPETAPGNLVGDVTFNLGTGCGAFDYGFPAAAKNTPPTAVAEAKRQRVKVGEKDTFSGSASFDAEDPPNQLTYAWDFDGNGTTDATGQNVKYAYTKAGTFRAKLTVTDTGKASDSDTISIIVTTK